LIAVATLIYGNLAGPVSGSIGNLFRAGGGNFGWSDLAFYCALYAQCPTDMVYFTQIVPLVCKGAHPVNRLIVSMRVIYHDAQIVCDSHEIPSNDFVLFFFLYTYSTG